MWVGQIPASPESLFGACRVEQGSQAHVNRRWLGGFFVDRIIVIGRSEFGQFLVVNQDSLANLLRADLFTGDEVIESADGDAEFAGSILAGVQKTLTDVLHRLHFGAMQTQF
jgi:hypothetical protein